MKKFRVAICKSLLKEVEIEANSVEEAKNIAKINFRNGRNEYVPSLDNHFSTVFWMQGEDVPFAELED